MTYLDFHLYFSLPILLFAGFLSYKKLTRVHAFWIGVVCTIVLVFTTPWDNYAVYRRIWEFDNEKIWFRIILLPIEEYGFFFLQTITVCLLSTFFLTRRKQ